MAENAKHPIRIDLNQFKLHVELRNKIELTLLFNSPSRRFYLALIALVVTEMKKGGKIIPIPMEEHLNLLALLNESIGGSAGSSEKKNLLPRIYRKWQLALANLEDAPLFKVLGRKKEYDGGVGKSYQFTEAEKDHWANLFEYKGSEENVRLKFAIDKLGLSLDDIIITYGDSSYSDAWESFVSNLKGKEDLYVHSAPAKVASVEKVAFLLPDKPSIAVLPFLNLSDDPKQDFFSDGMTEEIITTLSKSPFLLVIARTSTFTYKGKAVKVKQVAEELGIRYVLEGSVRRSAEKVRVAAQLVDAVKGNHIWAERYDRDLEEIFALQDEIALRIMKALHVKLGAGDHTGETGIGTRNVEAFLKTMEAREYILRFTAEGISRGRKLYEEAVTLDPSYARPYAGLAVSHAADVWLGASKSPEASLARGIEMAEKAVTLDESDATVHSSLAQLFAMTRQFDKAVAQAEHALSLDSNSWLVLLNSGLTFTLAGRPDEAIPLLLRERRLNPFAASQSFVTLSMAYRMAGKYDEAAEQAKKAVEREPRNLSAHLALTAAYHLAGHEDEASVAAKEVLKIDPKFSLEQYAKTIPYKEKSQIDLVTNAWRKAGLR